jgi:site-specific DNA-cytosine methylase
MLHIENMKVHVQTEPSAPSKAFIDALLRSPSVDTAAEGEIPVPTAPIGQHPRIGEVWAAEFRDRVVHHLLYNHIAPHFIAGFVAGSSACIPGRGTLYAAQRLEHGIRSITQNWSVPAFYLKMAQGFPASYRIDTGADGKPLTKTAQVRMCGNSVCPPLSCAIVGANYAESDALGVAA